MASVLIKMKSDDIQMRSIIRLLKNQFYFITWISTKFYIVENSIDQIKYELG